MTDRVQKTVFVGLSGGVDSSVAALRLKKQGYRVVGVFIKVWHPDFLECDEERDRLDAMRVAAHLDIPFLTFDASEVYKRDVADYMIAEYKAGRTPNPDVMCNKHVKFGAFLDFARKNGAEYVATGHYARVKTDEDGHMHLYRGIDTNKDQSYFLWTLTQAQLAHTLFPLGDSVKDSVRKEAAAAGLPTARKHDSQGICFLGKVDIEEFLSHYVDLKEGAVLNDDGEVIGTHSGSLLYTIGQRHGFELTKKSTQENPSYVIRKDLTANTITVSHNRQQVESNDIHLHMRNEIINSAQCAQLYAQFRYRQTPFPVSFTVIDGDSATLTTVEDVETPSVGQSCVLYCKDECIGGGIIAA